MVESYCLKNVAVSLVNYHINAKSLTSKETEL